MCHRARMEVGPRHPSQCNGRALWKVGHDLDESGLLLARARALAAGVRREDPRGEREQGRAVPARPPPRGLPRANIISRPSTWPERGLILS